MVSYGFCPRCKQALPDERKNNPPVICPSCGWSETDFKYKQIDKGLQKGYIAIITSLSAIAIGAFIHLVHWDRYSVEVVPLMAKKYSQSASVEDLIRLADICEERMKYDCTSENLIQAALFPNQKELLARAGELAFKRDQLEAARGHLESYFAQGGMDLQASYIYAQVLGDLGHVDRSTQYFEYILSSKPETLQVTITHKYVRMLINNNRHEQAKTLLQDIREKGGHLALFMEKEWKEVSTH